MSTILSNSEKLERLKKLVSHFHTAMLVTHTADGVLRSRPMAIADSHGDQDHAMLYFSTGIESPKVEELEADPRVNVVMQDTLRYVSLSGTARLVEDRALVEKLWSESWRVWFPKGKDDPSLRILIVEPSEAAYWDMTGMEGLKYVFEAAKAYLTGTRPDSDDDDEHAARLQL